MTPREQQVARALLRRDAHGRFPTIPQVAKQLDVSVATARQHLRILAMKLPNPHGLPPQSLVRASRDLIEDGQSSDK